MRRIVPALALSALVLTALPTAAAPDKLQTFGTGVVTAGVDSATIVNDAGEYGGVYLKSKSLSSKLESVDVSFRSTGDVGGGAPRFSVPIDDRDPSTSETYAFLDVNGCGGPVVSTSAPNCQVSLNSNFAPTVATTYPNWAAFAAANPTFRVQPGGIPFIIADAAGSYEVTDVQLR